MFTDDLNEYDFGVDEKPDDLVSPNQQPRRAIIRTSDRSNFRRCRRRWNWSSHLRQNLTSIESASPLWFGSGFHFAMEDFHGLRQYESPVAAFEDYVRATYKMAKGNNRWLPVDWPELVILGRGMLGYYADTWLQARDPLRTYWHDGVPQVEVNVHIPLPLQHPDYDEVLYGLTMDRIVIDDDGFLWIVDYKTAKRIQTQFFQTDPQISAYCWAASQLYGKPIGGFIYQQHRKDVPVEPRILTTGKLSTADSQLTTHRHYRRCLLNIYGDVLKAPRENIDFLNWLETQETSSQDKFVRRDYVYRNAHQVEAEGAKILMEVEDMLNGDLPLYPNPTRECGHLCNFNNACISLDDGSDWEQELKDAFRQKEASFDAWREFLPKPKQERESHFS
jgi:hypothetical protein